MSHVRVKQPKKSTNETIEGIINTPLHDDDDEKYLAAKEKRAREHLSRALLYGGGSRANLPKVRRKKKAEHSPFTVLEPKDLPVQDITTKSMVPPGVHEDIFRLVCNPTERSRNDPMKYFFTTTSMTDGVQTMPGQPPWYVGYRNTVKPPDSSILMSAARYGFRGSKEIKQYLVQPYQSPRATFHEHVPKFLDGSYRPDEWVPPILATTVQTINNLETPKLWPENTRYVTGSKLKELPKSVQYKRETTVANSEPPEVPPTMTEFMDRCGDEEKTLRDYAKMETTNTFMSLPMTAQATFDSTWKDRLSKSASSTLKITLNQDVNPYQDLGLTDSSDAMRYSGSTAMIVHTQSSDELKFRMIMEKTHGSIPYDLRWKQVTGHFKNIKGRVKRDQSMAAAIRDIGAKLRRDAIAGGSPTTLKRSNFNKAIAKISLFDGVHTQQVAMLFSAFDHLKKNCFRFVEMLLGLVVLDEPRASALEKLGAIWAVHEMYGDDMPPLEIAQAVLCSCCANARDKMQIEKLFKKEFRPVCYDMAIHAPMKRSLVGGAGGGGSRSLTDAGAVIDGEEEEEEDGDEDDDDDDQARGSSSILKKGQSKGLNPMTVSIEKANLEAVALMKDRQGTRKETAIADLAPFNLSDEFLNERNFVKIVSECPIILAAFDEQLSARLIEHYGKDPRQVPKTEEVEVSDQRDFAWILKSLASTAGGSISSGGEGHTEEEQVAESAVKSFFQILSHKKK